MTSFGDFVLPSDEEDDEDDEEYVPTKEESSCDEISSEEDVEENETSTKTSKAATKRKKVQKKTKKDGIAPRKRRRGCFAEAEDGKTVEEEKDEKEEEEEEEGEEQKKEEEKTEAEAAGRSESLWKDFLQRSKQPVKRENETKTVEKLYDFAGETVRVTETVAAKPAPPKKPSASDLFPPKPAEPQSSAAPSLRPTPSPSLPPAGPPPRANGKPAGGVTGILEKLAAKKKMSVLDKSRLDWNSFTSKEGIKEELQIHNRGKDGYLEKVAFLERADYRQFEKERDLRLGVKRTNR